MRATATLGMVILSVLAVAIPANAGTTSACTFDASAAQVEVSLAGKPNVLTRDGSEIVLNGAACGAATVTNTDSIVVVADGSTPDSTPVGLVLDLRHGRFAPGLTDEGTGSEIEIELDFGVHQTDVLELVADKGSQRIAFDAGHIDLDADEVNPEPDVVVSGLDPCDGPDCDYVFVATGDGPDQVVQRIGHGTDLFVSVRAGAGDDRVWATSLPAAASFVNGGGGHDVLRTDGDVDLEGGSGSDLLVGGNRPGHRDSLSGEAGVDRIFGRDGVDVMSGGAERDVLVGGEAADQVSGDRGHDRLWGGAGSDHLSGGSGYDRCEPEPGWTLSEQRCERPLSMPPPAL